MGKIVKRLALDDSFAIGRNESWLSDMAQEGLHLRRYGRLFVYFEKGAPQDTKYRIDIFHEQPSPEQLAVYRDCGWDYVARNGLFYTFCADGKADTTELHTDPVEQSYTMEKLNKRHKINLVIVSIAIVLFLSMILSIYVFNDEPFLYMINGQFVQQMLVVMVELYVFYSVIRNYLAISALKKSLAQGRPINHQADYKRARRVNTILASIFIPMALCTIFIPLAEMSMKERYTLPTTANPLPVVRLADIEQNPKLLREEHINDKGIDFANQVRYQWSFLAPIQYDIGECGIIADEMWHDHSGSYSPSITTRFYKLTFAGMADDLINDLITRYVYSDNIKVSEVSFSGLDKLYIAKDDIRKHIFASLDNKVIFITYYGNKNMEDIIPLVAAELVTYK